MKRKTKKILSFLMAALLVFAIIPDSIFNVNADTSATPTDASEAEKEAYGYVTVSATDVDNVNVAGVTYLIYSDEDCTNEEGRLILSCDGKSYLDSDGNVITYEALEDIEGDINYVLLPSGTYYLKMYEKLYVSGEKTVYVTDYNISYDESVIEFYVSSDNGTHDTALVVETEIYADSGASLAYTTSSATTWSGVKTWIKTNFTNNASTSLYCAGFVSDVINNNTDYYTKITRTDSSTTLKNNLISAGYRTKTIKEAMGEDTYTFTYKTTSGTSKSLTLDVTDTGFTVKCDAESTARKALASALQDFISETCTGGEIVLFYDPNDSTGSTIGHSAIVWDSNGNLVYSSGSGGNIRIGNVNVENYVYYDNSTSTGYAGAMILSLPTYGSLTVRKWSDTSSYTDSSTNNLTGVSQNASGSSDAAEFTIYMVNGNNDDDVSSKNKVATATIGGKNYYVTGSGSKAKFAVKTWSVTSFGEKLGAKEVATSNALAGGSDYGANGYETKLKVPAGWYLIRETNVPDGYEGADDKWVHITGSSKTVTRKNYKKEDTDNAYIYLNKTIGALSLSSTNYYPYTDNNSAYNMAGITFYFKDSSGNNVNSAGHTTNGRSINHLVVSYDGYAYMDEDGYNIIFATESLKESYENSHELRKFKWWRDASTDNYSGTATTYAYISVSESTTVWGSSYVGTSYDETNWGRAASKNSYWYSSAGTNAGKSVEAYTGLRVCGNKTITFTTTYSDIDTDSKTAGSVSITATSGTSITMTETPKAGKLALTKSSETTDPSDYYSTDGAVYAVKSSYLNQVVATFTVKNGVGIPKVMSGVDWGAGYYSKDSTTTSNNWLVLPLGEYTIYETDAPDGYSLSSDTWTLKIYPDSNGYVVEALRKNSEAWTYTTYENTSWTPVVTIAATDQRHDGSLSLYKVSSDSDVTDDNCNYDMTGAVYTLYYYYNNSYQSVGTFTMAKGTGSNSDKYVGIPKTTTLGNTLGITYTSSQTTVTTLNNHFDNLPFGQYKIVETTVPYGYNKDENIQVTTSTGTTSNVFTLSESNYSAKVMAASTETPNYDPLLISIQKKDALTGEAAANGSGSLAGAQFTINYYAVSVKDITTYEQLVESGATPTRTWVFETDEDGHIDCSDTDYFVSGDELYYQDGIIVVPYGCITIEETTAPEGYTTEGSWFIDLSGEEYTDGIIFSTVTSDSDLLFVDGENVALTKTEKSNRADIRITKIDAETKKPLSDIAFALTSVTTGETHILVTDENGVIDTSAINNSENTNANDTAAYEDYIQCGIWFYGNSELAGSIDDDEGALPYDIYTLSEIDTDGNEGYVLIDDVTIDLTDGSLYTDGYYYLILGNISNVPEPVIGTKAFATSTGDNVVPADTVVEVTDEVSYSYLTAGYTYTIKGIIMDAETGLPFVDIDGDYVTGSQTFTVDSDYESYKEEKCGTVSVSYSIDTIGLDGKSVVVYEYLYMGEDTSELVVNEDGSIDETGVYTTNTGTVIKHTDLTDENQTLYVPEIHTTLTDSVTEDHVALADSEVTLIDTVYCNNLVVGKEYTLSGVLENATDECDMLDASGNKITAEKTFTATSAEMSVDIVFTFDGSLLNGETTVAFETLYHNDIEVAVHADITDEGQTVEFPSVSTKLITSDGNKEVVYSDSMSLVDVWTFSNLPVGEKLTFVGKLYNADTEEVLKDADGEISKTVKVTLEDGTGTLDIAYKFDGTETDLLISDTEVSDIVAVVYVYDSEGNLIAEHSDLTDENQTITVYAPDTPYTPNTPNTPNTPGTPSTGDSAFPIAAGVVGIISILGIIIMCILKKKCVK